MFCDSKWCVLHYKTSRIALRDGTRQNTFIPIQQIKDFIYERKEIFKERRAVAIERHTRESYNGQHCNHCPK